MTPEYVLCTDVLMCVHDTLLKSNAVSATSGAEPQGMGVASTKTRRVKVQESSPKWRLKVQK
jgi:hypothetical protein